jgi:hypothetical protein
MFETNDTIIFEEALKDSEKTQAKLIDAGGRLFV